MIESWYVIRTDPRSEHQAANEIRELGWEVFLPSTASPNLGAKRQQSELFPGYLFVKIPLTHENQVSVSRARHVAGWVHFEHTLIDVPDEIIRELQTRLAAVNRNHVDDLMPDCRLIRVACPAVYLCTNRQPVCNHHGECMLD